MKASYTTLPDGYREKFSIDLQKDKKLALLVNMIALAIAIVMGVTMHFFHPVGTLFSMEGGMGRYALRFGVLVVGSVLYIVLHELTHAVAMRAFGTKKVKFGFTGMYAFAGSDDYYSKIPYLVIALSPVVVFAVLLGVLQFFVVEDFFWVVWLIQITNISGAAGDFYVTARFLRLGRDVLISDYGVGMTVYEKAEQASEAEEQTQPQAITQETQTEE